MATASTQLDWWLSEGSPFSSVYMSVSGGFDTRASLALIKEHRDNIQFFTYKKSVLNDYNKNDALNTEQLTKHINLNHQYLDLDKVVVSQSVSEACINNTDFSHSTRIAQAYVDMFASEKNPLHIRSNAYEIVRGHYRKIGFNNSYLTPGVMNHITYSGHNKDPFSIEAFDHWYNLVDWKKIESLGYDPLDFLYWEHRMGVWLSPVLHESDLSCNTAILINSRSLIDSMINLPFEDRKFNEIFTSVITHNWPQLADIHINGYKLGESPDGAYH